MDDVGNIAYAKIKFFGSKISNVVPINDIREFAECLPKDKNDFSKDKYYGLLNFNDNNRTGTYVPVQISSLAYENDDLNLLENARASVRSLRDCTLQEFYNKYDKNNLNKQGLTDSAIKNAEKIAGIKKDAQLKLSERKKNNMAMNSTPSIESPPDNEEDNFRTPDFSTPEGSDEEKTKEAKASHKRTSEKLLEKDFCRGKDQTKNPDRTKNYQNKESRTPEGSDSDEEEKEAENSPHKKTKENLRLKNCCTGKYRTKHPNTRTNQNYNQDIIPSTSNASSLAGSSRKRTQSLSSSELLSRNNSNMKVLANSTPIEQNADGNETPCKRYAGKRLFKKTLFTKKPTNQEKKGRSVQKRECSSSDFSSSSDEEFLETFYEDVQGRPVKRINIGYGHSIEKRAWKDIYAQIKASLFAKNLLRALYNPKQKMADRSCQGKNEAKTPRGINVRQKMTPSKRKCITKCTKYYLKKKKKYRGDDLDKEMMMVSEYLTAEFKYATMQERKRLEAEDQAGN